MNWFSGYQGNSLCCPLRVVCIFFPPGFLPGWLWPPGPVVATCGVVPNSPAWPNQGRVPGFQGFCFHHLGFSFGSWGCGVVLVGLVLPIGCVLLWPVSPVRFSWLFFGFSLPGFRA